MAHDQRAEKARVAARPLILASISPRRKVLLRTFGLPFRVVEPKVREVHRHGWPPARLVAHNARLKALAVAATRRTGVIVAADTLVVLDGRLFGKPRSAGEAARMLRRLCGRPHRVYTGVCVIDLDHRRRWTDAVSTNVTLRPMSAAEIAHYATAVAHRDKAGAYAIQDVRGMVVDRIAGSLSNVVGLPLHVVERRLRQCGLIPWSARAR